ncbi:MAG: phosphoadenylyl-sulfate reductase [Hyphomicrobium sp.]
MGQSFFEVQHTSNAQVGSSASDISNSPKEDKKLLDLNTALAASSSLSKRLHIIAEELKGRTAFSTSLGLEDQAIFAAVAEAELPFDVFTLDTGRHFAETYDILSATEARYKRRIRIVYPEAQEVESLVARDGILGFRESIENRKSCCQIRKVHPLQRALKGATAWITGLRRSQSLNRSEVPFAHWDQDYNLIKLNPIADWSLETLNLYIEKHAIPINALHKMGFPSIGCQPCTRAILPGEDIRAGRWWWENNDGKECGLHHRGKSQDSLT